MNEASLSEIREKIKAQHAGDERQLEVIFSDRPRLIVEAPAGYGKTTTMISRIAYLFAADKISNPKRILGLTFSVNAALKVKREVSAKLPSLIKTKNSPVVIGEKAVITNYHGFCKGVLKKYGYLISPILRKDVNMLCAVDENKIQDNPELKGKLSQEEQEYLIKIDGMIKKADMPDPQDICQYNEIVTQRLIPFDYITHNAIILLTLEIFRKYAEIQKFYQNYYTLIVVDEFQDTNCIAWALLEAIISDKTQLLFLGDSLQRIYGFIGALPDIMSMAVDKYCMTKVVLSKNYRFRDNADMLKLDRNIRLNAETCFAPYITSDSVAELPAFWGRTQYDEADQIARKVQNLIEKENGKIAILLRGRGKNVEIIENELSQKGIPYFYGMFTDEEKEYVDFHNDCQNTFIRKFGHKKNINKNALLSFLNEVKSIYPLAQDKTVSSLIKLLEAFVTKVSVEYADLLPEEKYELILDIFENHQLKQAMEYVDSNVILSTVHGAKGLEWENVILGDLERYIFPGYYTCNKCANRNTTSTNCKCSLPTNIPDSFKESILDELSVFYVGVTRAKKQVFVSASADRLDIHGRARVSLFSCMASLPGIKLIPAEI